MNLSPSHASDKVKDKPKSPLVLLQSLRAVAAGMVVFFHLGLWSGKYFSAANLFPSGIAFCESGVDLFFVISGFIMMHITPKAHRSWRDQGIFLFRRFARIYPAYWAIAIPLILLWCWNPKLINNWQGNHVDVAASLLLYPGPYVPVLFVGWTLICELTYYLIASFIFYFEGLLRMMTIVLWFAVILISNILHPNNFSNPWVNTFHIALTLEFISGMILADFLRRGIGRIKPLVAAILVIAAFLMIIVAGARHGTYIGTRENFSRVFNYGLPAFVIVWMVLQMDIQAEWRWLAKLAPLGDRSYSLYLLHVPVIALVYRLGTIVLPGSSMAEALLFVFASVAALMIPVECLYRLVERPSHSYARILTARSSPSRHKPALESSSS